ncbi:MAG: GxxExxY protein [Kiritimatiellia bacterium]
MCDIVRQNAYDLYRYLGPGHMEKVYENGLVHRLTKSSLSVQQQLQLSVQDEDGTEIGNLIPDLLIENFLIVECKSVQQIIPVHEAQILGYLRSANLKYGLLINFGTHRFSVKRYISTPFQRQNPLQRESRPSENGFGHEGAQKGPPL